MFGFILTIIGPALPYLADDFNLKLSEVGIILSLRGIGMIFAVLAAGVISDRYGHRIVVLSGIGFWTIGLLVFSICRHIPVIFLVWILIGVGFGSVDTALNSLVAQTSTSRGSSLNKLHFWFGIGSLTGPLVAGLLLELFSWRLLFFITALLTLGYGIFMFGLNYPQLETKAAKQAQQPLKSISSVLTVPVLLLGIILFSYTGVNTTFTGWINTYLTGDLALTTTLASVILSVYSIGLSLGRLVVSLMAERVPYVRTLLISVTTALVFASTALFAQHPALVMIAFGLTGFCFAALLPIGLAVGAKLYPEITGTVTGVLIFFSSMGRTVLPGLVGIIGDYTSLAFSLRLTLIFIGIMVISTIALIAARNKQRRKVNNI